MQLILDIGNTHTRSALWDGERFDFLPLLKTAELTREGLPAGIPVAAATVVPEIKERLGTGVFFLDSRNCGSRVDFTRIDNSTLGADRVANAIALAEFFPLPGIVIDCGTAITLEIVDEDRVFRGGAIAPGRKLMRRALFAGTAQLPEIPLSAERPEEAGEGTAGSIRFGIDCGVIGLVRELIAVSARPFGDKVSLVLTGGDAAYFAGALPGVTVADEAFTLHGIRLGAKLEAAEAADGFRATRP